MLVGGKLPLKPKVDFPRSSLHGSRASALAKICLTKWRYCSTVRLQMGFLLVATKLAQMQKGKDLWEEHRVTDGMEVRLNSDLSIELGPLAPHGICAGPRGSASVLG